MNVVWFEVANYKVQTPKLSGRAVNICVIIRTSVSIIVTEWFRYVAPVAAGFARKREAAGQQSSKISRQVTARSGFPRNVSNQLHCPLWQTTTCSRLIGRMRLFCVSHLV